VFFIELVVFLITVCRLWLSVLFRSMTSHASATQCLLVFGFPSHVYRYAVYPDNRWEIYFQFLSIFPFRAALKKLVSHKHIIDGRVQPSALSDWDVMWVYRIPPNRTLQMVGLTVFIFLWLWQLSYVLVTVHDPVVSLRGLFVDIHRCLMGKGGARGDAVGWSTALQTGRSRVRFPMVLLEFFIDIILPVALWPWDWLSP
jgi:hypothetical protein